MILAALRKVLNDQPGPTFTAQYAANATVGKPNPGLGKTLEEKLLFGDCYLIYHKTYNYFNKKPPSAGGFLYTMIR